MAMMVCKVRDSINAACKKCAVALGVTRMMTAQILSLVGPGELWVADLNFYRHLWTKAEASMVAFPRMRGLELISRSAI